MWLSIIRLSRQSTAAMAASMLVVECPVGMKYRSTAAGAVHAGAVHHVPVLSIKCRQHHVDSQRRRQNIDFSSIYYKQFYLIIWIRTEAATVIVQYRVQIPAVCISVMQLQYVLFASRVHNFCLLVTYPSYSPGGTSVHRHVNNNKNVNEITNYTCHFRTVQLFYNSCAQIIHRIRPVAPLCTAMWHM